MSSPASIAAGKSLKLTIVAYYASRRIKAAYMVLLSVNGISCEIKGNEPTGRF